MKAVYFMNISFSCKGYNLPPVGFLSSVDSERNLKSLALSFMRWLIHASLAVSPKITSCGKVFGLNDKDDVTSYLQQRLENDFTGNLCPFIGPYIELKTLSFEF